LCKVAPKKGVIFCPPQFFGFGGGYLAGHGLRLAVAICK